MLPPRFLKESLASHWDIDSTDESFLRLLYHINFKTNMRVYFEKSFHHAMFILYKYIPQGNYIMIDLGAGVGWTSAIMATNHKVKKVYAIEPNKSRRDKIFFVANHFNVADKIEIVDGNFKDFNIKTHAHLILMSGALHHCCDRDIPLLLKNLREFLLPSGVIVVANEHYVNFFWVIRRILQYIYNLRSPSTRKGLFYNPFSIMAPDPYDNEHWRTLKELETIFKSSGFNYKIFQHEGDLCKDKPYWFQRLGWQYYYAILTELII